MIPPCECVLPSGPTINNLMSTRITVVTAGLVCGIILYSQCGCPKHIIDRVLWIPISM